MPINKITDLITNFRNLFNNKNYIVWLSFFYFIMETIMQSKKSLINENRLEPSVILG